MTNIDIPKSEILQYAIDNDMIDSVFIQEQIKMQRNEELLSKHPYKIWEGKDGKWYSYFPDKEKGRVLKNRNSLQRWCGECNLRSERFS